MRRGGMKMGFSIACSWSVDEYDSRGKLCKLARYRVALHCAAQSFISGSMNIAKIEPFFSPLNGSKHAPQEQAVTGNTNEQFVVLETNQPTTSKQASKIRAG